MSKIDRGWLSVRHPQRGLHLTPTMSGGTHPLNVSTMKECLFCDQSRFLLHRADTPLRVWRHRGEQNADIAILCRVVHSGEGTLVWAGISYGHGTQLHAIVGNLNAVRYRDEILLPIVLPFIRQKNTIFQHDNVRPHVARLQGISGWQKWLCAWLASVSPRFVPNRTRLVRLWSGSSSPTSISGKSDWLHTALQEESENISQVTSDNFGMFRRQKCAAVWQANGGHTGYWLCYPDIATHIAL